MFQLNGQAELFLDKMMIFFLLLKALWVDHWSTICLHWPKNNSCVRLTRRLQVHCEQIAEAKEGTWYRFWGEPSSTSRFQQIICQSVLTVSYRLNWNAEPLCNSENLSFTAYTAWEIYTAYNIKTSIMKASPCLPGRQFLLVCLQALAWILSHSFSFHKIIDIQREYPSNLDHKKKERRVFKRWCAQL